LNIEEEDVPTIKNVAVGKKRLSEICDLEKSRYKGYLLKVKTEAEVGRIY
jgi:methyl coenzyme M reductase subunit C-like uncharacterized protein (methanogenesis marker protein 7)